MGLDKRLKKASVSENSADDNTLEVIDEAIFQGACDVSRVKQETSEMEDIMEGDIILKVNPDGDWQIISGSNKSKYCMQHLDMFQHQDDKLPKVGDIYKSHQDFVRYISTNAKSWCFYYKCTESQNTDTENESYTYNCVYLKNREYKKKSQKKRHNFKTDCPCKIKLKRKANEGLAVVFVCNHHDHELSDEGFSRLQTNKKLSPYLKEVIMDLLSLEVAISKIRKYVEIESGVKMSRAFFYDVEKKMKLNNDERHISDKRLKELSDKMCVLEEIFSCDEDEGTQGITAKKKRNKTSNAQNSSKRIKYQDDDDCDDDEAAESMEVLEVNNDSQDSQDGVWVSDQCVPAGRSRNSTLDWDASAIANNEESTTQNEDQEDFACETYTDDYNSADYTVSETVQQEPGDAEGSQSPQFEYQTVVLQDEFGNVINCENDEQIVFLQQDENNQPPDSQTIGYFDGEKIIYVDQNEGNQNEGNPVNENTGHEVGVQTSSQKPGHSYVPVFDVYMKNGNVTGFVVDEKVGSTGGVEKGVQTPDDTVHKESQDVDEGNEIPNIPATNSTQEIVNGDTYTKHEYIHRYNIDHYMTLANFPKYIDKLANKTRNDALSMLTRVYNEKAMFKMTTTQRGKEGNTKIWYLTDVRRKGKYKNSEEQKMKRDKMGQYLTDILILKERVKTLSSENHELQSRNKYLEDVALRLAKLRSM